MNQLFVCPLLSATYWWAFACSLSLSLCSVLLCTHSHTSLCLCLCHCGTLTQCDMWLLCHIRTSLTRRLERVYLYILPANLICYYVFCCWFCYCNDVFTTPLCLSSSKLIYSLPKAYIVPAHWECVWVFVLLMYTSTIQSYFTPQSFDACLGILIYFYMLYYIYIYI